MKLQSAAEFEQNRGSDNEVWVKGFREGATRVRICPAERVVPTPSGTRTLTGTAAWPTYREHYDEGVGYFPCGRDLGEPKCVGCDDANPKVQQRNRRYAFNVMDENGRNQVFKIGSRLFRTLQGREQRIGTLTDRDYTVFRTGKGLETTYDVEPEEKYEVDFPPAHTLHNVDQILIDKYSQTLADYNGEGAAPVLSNDEQMGSGDISPNGHGTTEQAAAVVNNENPKDNEVFEELPSQPTEEQIESATTTQIKAWLDSREVEYASRAPRSRLVTMAKAKAAEPPY